MKNPIQPLVRDSYGTLWFKSNKIVEALLEFSKSKGFGMNEINSRLEVTSDDRQQFAQLIGYSLDGYASLSYVDDEALAAAQEVAEQAPRDTFTAKEAKAKSIRSLYKRIEQATDKGYFHIGARIDTTPEFVIEDLKKNGFNVTEDTALHYKITWN